MKSSTLRKLTTANTKNTVEIEEKYSKKITTAIIKVTADA